MISKALVMVAALAATITTGCSKAEPDDFAPPAGKEIVVFEGKVDPHFAGTWTSRGGNSTIRLSKDGSLNVETISFSPAGKADIKVDGQWLIKGDSMTFRYTDKNKESIVMQYTASLTGNKLKLDQGGGRLTTIYTRK